ncbi:MAG TPA: hypothetical protein VLA66_05305, partial [Thermoanaerobaculia bacterium]|nr:hypothetical protein [Thermoanaerobaculia bacterium]
GTTVELFETAAARLGRLGVDWRAFVLAAAPFTAAERRIGAAVDSARWAADRGARHVALIPTRSGNGTMELLELGGEWSPLGLAGLEEALARGLRAVDPARTVLVVDDWDLERVSRCDACFGERRERIARMNRTGAAERPTECARCR